MNPSSPAPAESRPTVAITGSTGLIGAALVDRLKHDYQVVGIDLDSPAHPTPGAHYIDCDLTDVAQVGDALDELRKLSGGHLASVVHLAAYYDFSGEPSPLYDKLTVDGTRRLLDGLQTFKVEQFLFSSSMLVMKSSPDGDLITEESPTNAGWDYPRSKLDAEEAIRKHRGDIPAIALRIAGVYDELCHSIPIAQQAKRIYERDIESHLYPGDQSHGQPFVHRDDVVDAVVQAIEKREAIEGFEVLLLAEDDLMSYGALQDRLGQLIHGDDWTTCRIPKSVARAGAWVKDRMDPDSQFIKPWMVDLADDHYPLDCSKAKQTLGWRPKHSLNEDLPQMIDRLKQDPRRWYEVNKLGEPPEKPLGKKLQEAIDEAATPMEQP
ncbi:NAD dependent epimerase/dehydratase family protein [Posidoniimonas corsicana]|uniref:NAD dependent epimerase/dehydratase family protein n=1 Tax=Posidoniimonas corsicana TaxID=1938618 RepID=A0A5C5V5X5_9BACT|nr:NAD(P)-dependent oxidoreductase [Posidoniimonas corsicana]TWT33470.1 NAD dependent epimerase/dehydratase family protein [Posidoniimonas corsicana]